MTLDRLQTRSRLLALYERYGALLTEHQRAVLDLHLRSDWSLGEIAEHDGTSRAAVHDIVRRSRTALEDYEKRLGLLKEAERRRRAVETLERELAGLKRRMARLSG
ncbi:MAG TPA: hypothetical protein VKT20_01395 [Candidatus Dormibacteraeota bacterium]|nr:hypothetical protein [Candidatus Dormibacteraeota bacterium]